MMSEAPANAQDGEQCGRRRGVELDACDGARGQRKRSAGLKVHGPWMGVSVRLCGLALLVASVSALAWPASERAKGGVIPIPPDAGTDCDDLSAEPITYGMVYDVPGTGLPGTVIDIHDIWLAGGCVGCHNSTAMGGLRLDQPEFGGVFLVYQSSFRDSSLMRAFPGDPERSLLHGMLSCTPPASFPVMPIPVDGNTQRIPRPLRAMVYDWIQQGARGVDGDGNPISPVIFRDSIESDRLQRNLPEPAR